MRPKQLSNQQTINSENDPPKWVNQGEENWQPGGLVSGELAAAIYRAIWTGR